MATYKIVIARYNEDIDWVNSLAKDNVIIYNKGPDHNIADVESITRLNIGRESETYLYYIISNYHCLPDYVLFMQGDPFFHMHHINPQNMQVCIDTMVLTRPTTTMPLFVNYTNEIYWMNYALKKHSYFELFFNKTVPEPFYFSAGAQYIVPKEMILNKPIEFYKKIYSMNTYNALVNVTHDCDFCHAGDYQYDPYSVNGWTLERLFMYIFGDIEVNDF